MHVFHVVEFRSHVSALTRAAADITGLPYIMDLDAEEVDKILAC